MSVTKFVTRKFGRLEVDDITGGSVSCTNVSAGSIIAPALTGSSIACSTLTGGLNTYAPILKGVNVTAATGQTFTASQLLSGSIVRTGFTGGSEYLPTGAALLSQLNILTNSQASVGLSFDFNLSYPVAMNALAVLTASTNVTVGGAASFSGGNTTAGSRRYRATLVGVSGSDGFFCVYD